MQYQWIVVLVVAIFSQQMVLAQTPPKPVKKEVIYKIHGHERKDNYGWMKDETRKDKQVLNYLKAENKYADEYLKNTKGLQKKLFNEIVSRIKENDVDVPYLYKGYYYYSKTQKGKNHPIFYRKQDAPSAKETILLDLNVLEKKSKNISLGGMALSPDQKVLVDVAPGIGWTEDNQHVFVVKLSIAMAFFMF